MITKLPPSPFLTESPESVETPSRVSTVMEAAAPQTPAGAAADTFTGTIPDDISDVHEIFHHARKLIAEPPLAMAEFQGRRWEIPTIIVPNPRQAEIDRNGLAAVEREISIWQRGAGAEYMAPLDVPLFLR
jgi:hypothetical protein